MTEQQRLQQFLADHLDFDSLQLMGFWEKGTRRTDYERQAARVCQYFGYDSVYEYGRNLPELLEATPGVVAGTIAAEVTADGTLQAAASFLLDVGPSRAFTCPVCTSPQQADDYARFRRSPEYAPVKCQACKSKLVLGEPGLGGAALQVTEGW